MHTPPSSLLSEHGHSFQSSLACLSSSPCVVDKDGNAQILELPTVMGGCFSRATCGVPYDNEPNEKHMMDIREVVYKPGHEVVCEAI
jgi:hypothetical protein